MSALGSMALSNGAWGAIALAIALLAAFAVAIQRKRARMGSRKTAKAASSSEGGVLPPGAVEMMSLKDIEVAYDERKARFEVSRQRVDNRLKELRDRLWERATPEVLLHSASPQERASVAAMVGLPVDMSDQLIIEGVRRAGSHSAAAQVRKWKGLEPHVAYREVLTDVAKKVGAPTCQSAATDAEVEAAVVLAVFKSILERATPEQRESLMRELNARQQKLTRGVGVAAGSLVLANLSGFGLYIAASSVLGAVTGALGLTLPFAAYTGMSTVIATVIGPVGWLALAIGAVAVLGGVNYKKTVPAVLAIATARTRLIAEREHEIDELVTEQQGSLAEAAANIAALRALLDRMMGQGLNEVPRASVPL